MDRVESPRKTNGFQPLSGSGRTQTSGEGLGGKEMAGRCRCMKMYDELMVRVRAMRWGYPIRLGNKELTLIARPVVKDGSVIIVSPSKRMPLSIPCPMGFNVIPTVLQRV